MSSQKYLSPYIGEPDMECDIEILLHTGHVGEYYEASTCCMRELMHGSDVTNEQRGACLTEIERYESLLLHMRYDVYLYNNRHVFWDKNNV